jgi:manganese-dependent inorganic pyrophosphatase
MNGQKVGVGVWETVLPQTILERKEEIVKFLAEKKQKEGLRAIFFASVDILNNLSDFIILGEDEKEAGEKAFGGEVKDNILHLPGVVSRKKQMIPPLEGYFSQK